jgi:drug/metabolite transporter (DMT)-like permease
MGIVALLVKLDSKGPVFYRQERTGQAEKPFLLVKFRTMREDAETGTGPVWASVRDYRVTRVGRWLRQPGAGAVGGRLLTAIFLGTYLAMWLQQVSLKLIPAGVFQTLFATSPLFVLPFAAWQGERVSLRAVLGAVVALAGVALLFAF